MTVDLICQRCDGSFEVDFADMLEGEPLQCPNCDNKASTKLSEEFAAALDELMARIAELRPKFELSLAIESDDLPAKFAEDGEEDDEDDDDEPDEDDEDDDETDDEETPDEESP